tara:strand:+ start:2907 stop:6686 length:3780 start_codon:yes stop_codon:yes gene_type:complete
MPLFGNALAGAAGSGGGDFSIERSLRLDRSTSAYLLRQPSGAGTSTTTCTISLWAKACEPKTSGQNLFFAGTHGNNGFRLRFGQGGEIRAQLYNTSGSLVINAKSLEEYHDPMAWFHYLISINTSLSTASDRVRVYKNGTEVTYNSPTYPPQNEPVVINSDINHYIGAQRDQNTQPAEFFHGMIAEFHCVDGQAKGPLDFGEFTDDGVWRPIKYNGTHGTNGFYLDFKDDSSAAALGYDAAGSNNFTPYNISVSNLVSSGNGYDGSLNGYMPSGVSMATSGSQLASTSNRTHFFLVDQGNNTNIEVVATATSMTVGSSVYDGWGSNNPTTTLNDGTVTPSSSGTDTSVSGKNLATNTFNGLTVGTTYTISTKNGGAGNPHRVHYVTGATVQNKPIVDSDSLIDSPSNIEADSGNNVGNYATLNSLANGSGSSLTNGNLEVTTTTGAYGDIGTTIAPMSGKFYVEFALKPEADRAMIGISADSTFATSTQFHTSSQSWAYYSNGGVLYNNSSSSSFGDSYKRGDVIGIALDKTNNKLYFSKNGIFQNNGNPSAGTGGIDISSISGKPTVFVVNDVSGQADTSIAFNAGQYPFASTPPTGFLSLCTKNLTEPVIDDGTKNFNTLLYTGNGTTGQSVTGLDFKPSLVWIKERSHSGSNCLVDDLQGNTKVLLANTNQPAFNKTQFFDSFDSNGISVDYNGVDSSVVSNRSGKTYAAWCWNGGDLVTLSTQEQSQTWTTGSASGASPFGSSAWAHMFDGVVPSTFAHANLVYLTGSGTFTFPSAISGRIQVYAAQGSSTAHSNNSLELSDGSTINVTNGNASFTLYDFGTKSNITSITINGANTSSGVGVPAILLDGKMMVDPGLITVGSLNSSTYNSGEVWSTTGTLSVDLNGSTVSNMTGPLTKAFEGSLASSSMVYEGSAYTNGTKTYTYTFGTAQTNITSARVYLYQGNSAEGGAAGVGNGTVNKTQDGTYGWLDVTSTIPANGTVTAMTVTTTATSGVNSSRNGFHAIELNGKMLLDNGVTPVDNFPSSSSTCRANVAAGFSITKYAPNGNEQTIGHGLNGIAPEMIIVKNLDHTYDWYVYHVGLDSSIPQNKFINLNTNTAVSDSANAWNDTAPTGNVFTVKGGPTAYQYANHIAYSFRSVEGFSKIGTWTGSGSSNGPMVYTGFEVAWLLWKVTTSNGNSANWYLLDGTRDSVNPAVKRLHPNTSDNEATMGSGIDFLSNGFKILSSDTDINSSGLTYIYAAFSKNAFSLNGGLAR